MNKLKIAVVGLGHAANDFHLPNLTQFQDVEVSLCDTWKGESKPGQEESWNVDKGKERLEQSRQRWQIPGTRCFNNLDELMETIDPDGVYVVVPQHTLRGRPPTPYLEVVQSVLARGKPTFVEKPLAINAAGGKTLVDAAKNAGVVTTFVAYQRRFNPLLRMGLKRVRERGPLLNCTFGFFKGQAAYDPKVSPIDIPPHDLLTLDFIHCLDLMRWAPQGELVDFFSTTGKINAEPRTQFHVIGKFDNGCTSIFTSNMRAGARVLDWQLHGIGISVYITMNPKGSHYSAMVATIFTDDNYCDPEIVYDHEVAPNSSSRACVGFWQEDRHFVDCVKQGIKTECDFADALKTNELAERVLQDGKD